MSELEVIDNFVMQSRALPDVTDDERLRFLAEATDLLAKTPPSCRGLGVQAFSALSQIDMARMQVQVAPTIF
mgnify:CR=1 FL=1